MNISWTERKSNIKVLNMVDEPRIIIKVIGIRKTKFFGHVMWLDTFITNIMERETDGKRERGQPRETNLGNIKKLLSLASNEEIKISR